MEYSSNAPFRVMGKLLTETLYSGRLMGKLMSLAAVGNVNCKGGLWGRVLWHLLSEHRRKNNALLTVITVF